MQQAVEGAYLSYDALATTVVVLLGLCAAIVAFDKAVKVIKSWRAPRATMEGELVRRQAECDKHFKRDDKRLEALEAAAAEQKEIDRVMLQALRAILSHEINGNSVDRMREANEAIDDMLINR